MLKRDWSAESNGKLPHLSIPSKTAACVREFVVEDLPLSRTAALVPEFAVKYLPLRRILWWWWWWNHIIEIFTTTTYIDFVQCHFRMNLPRNIEELWVICSDISQNETYTSSVLHSSDVTNQIRVVYRQPFSQHHFYPSRQDSIIPPQLTPEDQICDRIAQMSDTRSSVMTKTRMLWLYFPPPSSTLSQ